MNDPPTETEQQPENPRVCFAAERTLLASMRTGLALMGFGFVVARFGLFLREIAAAGQVAAPQHSTGWSLWIGTGSSDLELLSAWWHRSSIIASSRCPSRGGPTHLALHCWRSSSVPFSPYLGS